MCFHLIDPNHWKQSDLFGTRCFELGIYVYSAVTEKLFVCNLRACSLFHVRIRLCTSLTFLLYGRKELVWFIMSAQKIYFQFIMKAWICSAFNERYSSCTAGLDKLFRVEVHFKSGPDTFIKIHIHLLDFALRKYFPLWQGQSCYRGYFIGLFSSLDFRW